jgi:2-haloacid dehalogenase
MPRKYRAVLFDVYGTLLDVHGIAVLAEQHFPGSGMALSQGWRSKQLQYSWLRTLALRHADFRQVTADALEYAAEELSLPLAPGVRDELMQYYLRLPAFAGAGMLLQALRDKGVVALAALSNGSPEMLGPALERAGLRPLLDDVLSIEQVRRYKVAPEAYQLALDRFGGEPRDFLLVSSNGWDVAGATIFGFDTFWVNRTQAPVERLGVVPTAIGTQLDDLVAWLG